MRVVHDFARIYGWSMDDTLSLTPNEAEHLRALIQEEGDRAKAKKQVS